MEDVANQEVAPQVPSTKSHVIDSKIWIIIAALVLLVLLIGGFYLYRNNGLSMKNQTISTKSSTPTPTSTPTPQNNSNIKNSSASNSQLDSDMQQVNSDYNNLNSDATSVDQGLNDKETNLQ